MDQNLSTRKQVVTTINNSPAEMIKLAVSGGADLEKLEKLLSLQERWEANEARKIFAVAFAITQKNIEMVIKTKINPQTHSKYADLGDIIEHTKPIYTEQGFSVIFYEKETNSPECIRVCVDILHRAGHKETCYLDIPLDGVGIKGNPNMTKIHAKASSISYARRYLMCMIWNIPTKDTDGNVVEEKIDDNKVKIIKDLLVGVNESKFFEFMGVEKIEDIRKDDYFKAKTALEARKAKKSEVKNENS